MKDRFISIYRGEGKGSNENVHALGSVVNTRACWTFL